MYFCGEKTDIDMKTAIDTLIQPPALREGDRVVIVSPSSKIDPYFLRGAVERLRSWGLDPVLAPHADGSCGRYAGTTAERLADLQGAMDDPQVRAILCSRGGYGAVHLLEGLDFTRLARSPKWLIGFSDITALHAAFQRAGFASLHAPMARHLTVEPADDEATLALHDQLFGIARGGAKRGIAYTCEAHRLNRRGRAEGTLRGGNLSVFYGLRGTPWDFPPEHTLLFLEDVGERPHAVERMLYNLRLGGVLHRLAGIVVGQFTEYKETLSLGKPLLDALADVMADLACPVCFDFPVGHVTRNLPLVCGAHARLEVGRKEVKLTFD